MDKKITLPDTLPVNRYRVKVDGEDVYLSVSFWQDVPVEVFASYPESWRHEGKAGMIEMINMGISAMLRIGFEVEEIIEQARHSSVSNGGYPARLAEVLGGLQ